jgi:predicted N-acyltransferase
VDLFLATYAHVTTGSATLPSYLIGGRRPGHSEFLTGGAPGERQRLLTAIIGAAAEAAAAEGAATLAALYCDRDDTELAAAFAANGGVRVPAPSCHVLDLPGTFDDWLASLPSKRAGTQRADRRRLAAAGVAYEVRPLRAEDIDEIVPLELSLYDKYGHGYHESEATGLHRAYLAHLGADALLVRATREGRLIGFASLVRHGRHAYARQGGFDPDGCAGLPVYFGAAYHAPITWAATAGVDLLDLSIGADEAKHHRGARALARDAWIVPLHARARWW